MLLYDLLVPMAPEVLANLNLNTVQKLLGC